MFPFGKPQYRYKKETDIQLKEYECEYYTVLAPKTSCFFCKNCPDIFFDLEGPYAFICEERKTLDDKGLDGTCKSFKEG